MVLIDHIVDWGEQWIETTVNRHSTALFQQKNGEVSSMVAMEYLCQSAASHAGIRQLESGKDVTIGFIIGARQFEIDPNLFYAHHDYQVRVDQTFLDAQGIAVYDCRLYPAGKRTPKIAHAIIKAVMPDDPALVINKRVYQTAQ